VLSYIVKGVIYIPVLSRRWYIAALCILWLANLEILIAIRDCLLFPFQGNNKSSIYQYKLELARLDLECSPLTHTHQLQLWPIMIVMNAMEELFPDWAKSLSTKMDKLAIPKAMFTFYGWSDKLTCFLINTPFDTFARVKRTQGCCLQSCNHSLLKIIMPQLNEEQKTKGFWQSGNITSWWLR